MIKKVTCGVAEVSKPTACGLHVAKMATNVSQHKIINSLKTFFCSSVFVSVCIFNVWPKRTFLLPVHPRDIKSLDTPGRISLDVVGLEAEGQ